MLAHAGFVSVSAEAISRRRRKSLGIRRMAPWTLVAATATNAEQDTTMCSIVVDSAIDSVPSIRFQRRSTSLQFRPKWRGLPQSTAVRESLCFTRRRLGEGGAIIAAELPDALIKISYAVLLASRPSIHLLLPCRRKAIEPLAFD